VLPAEQLASRRTGATNGFQSSCLGSNWQKFKQQFDTDFVPCPGLIGGQFRRL
jgi:hypothetical protein